MTIHLPTLTRPTGLVTRKQLDIAGVSRPEQLIPHSGNDWIRIGRGAYCEKKEWAQSSARTRHLMQIWAHTERSGLRDDNPIISHDSAAVVWDLPLRQHPTSLVHVTVNRYGGGSKRKAVYRHGRVIDDSDVIADGGLRFTSALRTVRDVSRTAPFASAVMTADAALARSLFTLADIHHAGESSRTNPLSRKEAFVLEFADGRSGSPGESLSRVLIHELGFPAPQLQTEHIRPSGQRAFTDFEWPDYSLIGEFDGAVKYLDPAARSGATAEQVVYAEKLREDDLRAEGRKVIRWGNRHLADPGLLVALLVSAGLPRRIRRSAHF